MQEEHRVRILSLRPTLQGCRDLCTVWGTYRGPSEHWCHAGSRNGKTFSYLLQSGHIVLGTQGLDLPETQTQGLNEKQNELFLNPTHFHPHPSRDGLKKWEVQNLVPRADESRHKLSEGEDQVCPRQICCLRLWHSFYVVNESMHE